MTEGSYALIQPTLQAEGARHDLRAQRLLAYAICSVLAIGWTLFAGKDVPWDALHYHVYAGYSVFNDRLATDFFPAGTQTYLNPYSHVPLYLMVRAGWSSVAVGVAFAVLQSVMLWMTWELARVVCRRQDGSSPGTVVWAAVALALINPVFLQELGSSFNDITTGTFALGAYVALANAFHGGRLHLVALGGALLGIASALKLSNATFMLAPALPLVVGCVWVSRQRVRALLIFGMCAGGAMIAMMAPWSIQLERAFANPFFPMLDGFFRASNAAAAAPSGSPGSSLLEMLGQLISGMRDPRFLPSSLAEAFARPLDILFSARRFTHTEPVAPDVRYAGLMALALAGLVAWVVSGRRRSTSAATSTESRRAYAGLGISFAASWAIWLGISGNSRYFLPMASVAAVLLVAGLYRLLAAGPKRLMAYALVTLLGAQAVLLWQTRDLRWSPQPWGGPWLQAEVPLRLQREPQLYLPLDSQSQSFLLPFLAPGSAFLGVASGIGSDGYVGSRARELIEANVSRLRMLLVVKSIESDGRPVTLDPPAADFPLRRFGLKVDAADCEIIKYKGNPSVIERAGPKSGPRDEVQLYACRVVPGGSLSPAEIEGQRIADQVLDKVEDACPELFGQHRRGGSARSGQIWRRNYGDLALWVTDDGWVRFVDLIRGGGDRVAIGRVDDWLAAPQRLDCFRSGGRGYVELVQAQGATTAGKPAAFGDR